MRALAPALVLVTWAAQARAAPRCAVTFSPDDLAPEWRSAVASLQTELRDDPDVDCSTIAVQVSGPQAFVVFTTSDGRQAVRRIDAPSGLHPVVDALLVSVPPLPEPAPAPLANTMPTAATRAMGVAPEAERVPRPNASDAATHLDVALGAGVRLSTPGGFASPSFGARLGVTFGAWELAAMGQWDPTHAVLSGTAPRGFSMSRYAVGVSAGRLVPLASGLVSLGLLSTIAVMVQEGLDPVSAADPTGGVNAAEPIGGAYVAFVWPRRSALRLRSELSADAVMSRLGRTQAIDPALPALPWWSAAASAGVQWMVP